MRPHLDWRRPVTAAVRASHGPYGRAEIVTCLKEVPCVIKSSNCVLIVETRQEMTDCCAALACPGRGN